MLRRTHMKLVESNPPSACPMMFCTKRYILSSPPCDGKLAIDACFSKAAECRSPPRRPPYIAGLGPSRTENQSESGSVLQAKEWRIVSMRAGGGRVKVANLRVSNHQRKYGEKAKVGKHCSVDLAPQACHPDNYFGGAVSPRFLDMTRACVIC